MERNQKADAKAGKEVSVKCQENLKGDINGSN